MGGSDYRNGGPSNFENLIAFSRADLTANIALSLLAKEQNIPVAVSLDVQNFGDSISHSAVLMLCKKVGFSTAWIAFFKRFMRYPIGK